MPYYLSIMGESSVTTILLRILIATDIVTYGKAITKNVNFEKRKALTEGL